MYALLKKVTAAWAVFGGTALLTIVLVTTVNTGFFTLDRVASTFFGRNVRGLPGYEDFVILVIGGAALSFFPYCQLAGHHINVTLFSKRFPAALNRLLDRLWLALSCGTALFLAYWMVQGLIERRADNVITRVLGWPEWPFLIPGVVSLLLWALVAAFQLASRKAFDAAFPSHGAQ